MASAEPRLAQGRSGPPLVRVTELGRLTSWLTSAADGRCVAGLVGGEPGIGRTTLVEALAAEARWRGFTVATGRARAVHRHVAWAPLLQTLGPWAAAVPGELLTEPAPSAASFEQVARLLTDRCRHGPVVLLLEDLHWADRCTLAALPYLVERCSSLPLLILSTARGEHPPALAAWARTCRARGTHLPLGRLDATGADAVVDALGPADPETAVASGRGLPAAIVAAARPVNPPGRGPAPGLRAPGTGFPDLVEDHLQDLTGRERAVLGALAVAGPGGADLPLLAVLGLGDPVRTARDLVRLVRRDLVHVRSGTEPAYRVWHELAADVLADRLPAPQVRTWRALLAAACEERSDPVAVRVAAHLAAQDPATFPLARAAAVLTAGVAEATARDDVAEVLRLAGAARAAASRAVVPDADRARLLEQVAQAQSRTGRQADAVRTLQEAHDLACRSGRRDHAHTLRSLLDIQRWEVGPTGGPRPAAWSSATRDQAWEREAWALFWSIRTGGGAEVRRATARLLTAEDTTPVGRQAHGLGLGLAAWLRGDAEEALRHVSAVAASTPTSLVVFSAASTMARLRLLCGDAPGAVAAARQVRDRPAWAGLPSARLHALGGLVLAEYCTGAIRDAARHADQVVVEAARVRSARTTARGHLLRALLDAEGGEVAAARAGLGAAVQTVADGLDVGLAALADLVRALLATQEGTAPPVPAADITVYLPYPHVLCTLPVAVARAALGVGDAPLATAQATALRSGPHSPVLTAQVQRVEGLLTEDPAAGAELLTAAAESLDRCGFRLQSAQCRVEAAERLPAAGAPVAAALEYLHQEGVRPWAARGRRAARLAGVPVREHRPDDGPLTAREREVARLVAEGLSNAAIADRLFLSRRTVETHMRNIYLHLGAATRQEVALWALGQDLRAPAAALRGRAYGQVPSPGEP